MAKQTGLQLHSFKSRRQSPTETQAKERKSERERERERGRMESSSPEPESPVSISNPSPSPESSFLIAKKKYKKAPSQRRRAGTARREEVDWSRKGKKKGGAGVTLEGYVEAAPAEGGDLGSDGNGAVAGRTKSLTDEDLEELKGCLDLGFGFNYDEIPELCSTLPALELSYSMSQRFLDEQQHLRSPGGEAPETCAAPSPSPIANWKIFSPGDNPDEVKARLKYWAQAVACTVKLCS